MAVLAVVSPEAVAQSDEGTPRRSVTAEFVPQLGHSSLVSSVAYSPDGRHIVSAGWAATVRIWDTQTDEEMGVLSGHGAPVLSVVYSPDGRRIVSASRDGTVRVWDTQTRAEMEVLSGHDGNVNSLAYSPDGNHIVSAGEDGTVRIWDAQTGMATEVLRHDGNVNSVAYSPNGRRIVSAGADGTVRIWDAWTGEETAVLSGHGMSVRAVAYSPDGRRIVSASWDGTVRIWDARTGEETAVLSGHGTSVWSVAVAHSPDGRGIATAGDDGVVQIWNTWTGVETEVLSGHEASVLSVTYSADGSRIVSAGADGTVRTWLVEEHKPDLIFQRLSGQGWIGYRPGRLSYVASSDAERHLRIRFDGHRCPIFRLVYRHTLCPVYPLAWYREVLRQEPGELRNALQRPDPEIRPKELRLVWARADRTLVIVGAALLFILAIGAPAITTYTLSRRRGPLMLVEEFFVTAHDYRVERRLTEHALSLKDQDDARHYAVLNGDDGDTDVTALAERKERWNSIPMLFLIHTTSASETEFEHKRIPRTKGNIHVVPMALSAIDHALKRGTVDRTLNDSKERYVTRDDPYFESVPIKDPTLFYGRRAQLRTIRRLVAQGQHVGIFGLRKTGKTSLVKQLELRFNDVPVASISCQELDGYAASSFLSRIADELRTELRKRFAIRNRIRPNDDCGTQLRSLIAAWRASGRSEPFVVILDEIDSLLPFHGPQATHDVLAEGRKILGMLRALAQNLHGFVLLAIAYRPDVNRRNDLPADAGENPLFMGFHEVYSGSLSAEECDTMISDLGAWRDIEWDSEALRLLHEYCGGHPFVTRLFASDACERGQRKHVTAGRVEETADTIRKTMRNHRIHDVYKQVVATLRPQEIDLVKQIVSGSEALTERDLSGDEEDALSDLERLGLVDGQARLSARLFDYWVKRRLL